jgi:hypothetical protein
MLETTTRPHPPSAAPPLASADALADRGAIECAALDVIAEESRR